MDYNKIGLKCGLEIHQQLDTKKLFCNCPSLLRKDSPDKIVKRKLHAVAGESGEVDVAAKYQSELKKDFFYEAYDTTCLVELDEEPPREINKDALKIALQVAILLNAKIFPITQIMRKTVVDGSNTSGFQRTVLIARDGFVETKYGRVGIDSLCLEEDSARIVSEPSYTSLAKLGKEKDSARTIQKEGNAVVYRLDRLGIPLIEIATSPDIKNPEQAKEVALFLGNILRSCRVKRGIGTIRQDVNVSVRKGARVEIKGVQEPDLIAKAVEKEVERQLKLIEENRVSQVHSASPESQSNEVKTEVRKVLIDGRTEFLRPMPGAARMYPETDLPLLKISRDLINEVKKDLPKLKKEREEELRKIGLNEEMIKLLFKENLIEEFKELLKFYSSPNLVAKILIVYPKEITSKNDIKDIYEILTKEIFVSVLNALKKKQISENHVKQVLERIVSGKNFEEAIEFEKEENLEEKIHKIIKEKPGLSANAYMGLVMKEMKDKISGKEIREVIEKYLH